MKRKSYIIEETLMNVIKKKKKKKKRKNNFNRYTLHVITPQTTIFFS